MRRDMKRLVLAAVLTAGASAAGGCSYDGDHRIIAGVVLEDKNTELTFGDQAGKSPTRGAHKYQQNSEVGFGAKESASGFHRDE